MISKRLKCSCYTHFVDFEYDARYDLLTLMLRDIYDKQGNKYRKPKYAGDVVLTTKTINKLKDWLNGLKR